MPLLLTVHDAAQLRAVPQRAWLLHLSRWTLFVGGLAAFAMMFTFTPDPACTAVSPCYPLPFTSALVGFFAIMPFLAFLHLGFAAAAAAVLAGVLIWHDAILPSMAAPPWARAAVVGYAAVAALLFWLTRRASRSDVVSQWETRQDRVSVPVAGLDVRQLRRWSVLGAIFIVAGMACAAWSLSLQRAMDERQAAARVVTATVVEVNEQAFTVVASLPDEGQVTVDVWDTASYPPGSEHPLALDDKGLRQLIAEPYDATPWLALAVILTGLGAAGQQRRLSRLSGRRRLFTQPQPATVVWTRQAGDGDLLIYSQDMAPQEEPLWLLRVHERYVTGLEQATGLPPVRPAVLYGTPLVGRWCTVVMDGQTFSPETPLRNWVST